MFYATMEDYTPNETLTFDELPEGYSNAYTAMYDAHSIGKVVMLDINLSEAKHFVLPLAEIDTTTALFFGYYISNLQVATITETGETFTFISLDDLATLAAVKDYAAPHALTGSGAPTTSTVGVVGQMYVNTSTGDVYTCKAATATSYTWVSATPTMRTNISDKAGLSVKSNITLSATSWDTAKKYTISNTNITATSVVELLPRENGGITQAQMEALTGAMIVGGTQAAGSIQLIALGDVPTVDIPVTIIIRGDL